jgi:hypothetical protein
VVQALDANLVEQHYGVMGTPTYIAVGRSGKVAQRFVGALLDDSGIDRVLRALR